MESFRLTRAEFAAVAIFLNAKACPGLAIDLQATTDDDLLAARAQLQEHGYLTPGERPDTWHLDEPLMLAMLAVVRPNRLVLVRDLARRRSLQFCLDGANITAVLVLEDAVQLIVIDDADLLIEQALAFLENTPQGQVAYATVINGELAAGVRATTAGDRIQLEMGEEELSPRSLRLLLAPVLPNSP